MIRECEEEAAPVYDVRMLVMLSLIMVMMLVMMLVMMVMMVLSMMMVMIMMMMLVIMVMMVMMLVMMIRSPSSEQVSKKSSQFVLCHLVQPYSSRGILDGDGGIRW